ncbi:hypothetical protein ABEF93_001447 [Exophiala dermatitidis]
MADTAASPVGADTPSGKCAICSKTTDLKRCSKCHIIQYCSRQCQAADWKKHKKSCNKNNAANGANSGLPNHPGMTIITGTSRHSGIAAIDKPFTALHEKRWLHNRPQHEVYALLIDVYRLRMEDDYTFLGDADIDSIYGGAPNGYAGFRRFLKRVTRKPGLLPDWWTPQKATECEIYGRRGGWSSVNCAVEKSDIIEHYGNALMPMQLRMFGEQVYGTGPWGQSGEQMLASQMVAERGEAMAGTIDMTRLFR